VFVLSACSDNVADRSSDLDTSNNGMAITLRIASDFAQTLIAEEFEAARTYLTTEAQREYTTARLAASYHDMIAYGSGPIDLDGHHEFLADWSTRHARDIGWIYVSISGTDFVEAISVVVSEEGGEPKVSEIEWGRP
jgi:hypothetical protein